MIQTGPNSPWISYTKTDHYITELEVELRYFHACLLYSNSITKCIFEIMHCSYDDILLLIVHVALIIAVRNWHYKSELLSPCGAGIPNTITSQEQ